MPKRTKPTGPTPIPTWELRLNQLELLHLRDLFSVLLPPDGTQTVSQALATSENRNIVEPKLWTKVNAACKSAKIPLDDEAPDFVIMMAGAPTLGIFKVASEIQDEEESPAPASDPSALFNHPGDDDDGGAPEPTTKPEKKPRAKKVGAKGRRK